MMDVLFSIALVVLTVALIAMSMTVKHLSDEIAELKDGFEYQPFVLVYFLWNSNPKSKSLFSDTTNLKKH